MQRHWRLGIRPLARNTWRDMSYKNVTNDELLDELDSLVLAIHRRLEAYVAAPRDDVLMRDEGFRFAGLVVAAARTAAEKAEHARAQLEQPFDE